MKYDPNRWTDQFFDALVLMVAASLLIRFAYDLLRPMVPVLVVLLILTGLYRLFFGQWRR